MPLEVGELILQVKHLPYINIRASVEFRVLIPNTHLNGRWIQQPICNSSARKAERGSLEQDG